MESDWARLPQDLLVDIAMKLECVEQLVRFSAVCLPWKEVYDKVKPTWTPSMPWYILPELHRNDSGKFRTVFDPNMNKSYEMYLPELYGCRCWGCQDGWIFTLNLDKEIHLFNPLTKARLQLPSAHSIPSDVDNFDEEDQVHFLREYVQKVVLLHVPPNNELVVLLVCDYSKCITFAKPGDSQWVYMEVPRPSPLGKDVVKIEDDLLILYEDWSISRVGTDCFTCPNNYEANVFLAECEEGIGDNEVYLVESTGDLLLVYPFYAEFTGSDDSDDEFHNHKKIVTEMSIGVYIYDWDTNILIGTRDIGDAALFVGGGPAVSVCASKAANCRRNSVYFVADNPFNVITQFRDEEVNPLGNDIGVFDLEYRGIEKLYHEDYSPCSDYCPPFWFMPKLV